MEGLAKVAESHYVQVHKVTLMCKTRSASIMGHYRFTIILWMTKKHACDCTYNPSNKPNSLSDLGINGLAKGKFVWINAMIPRVN